MSILTRFKDIMSSNINAMLDKLEDPSKMIDQILRNLSEDLEEVKKETAGVMADETRAKREYDECVSETAKYLQYAEKAIIAGNDEDAKVFLAKKTQNAQKEATLKQAYEIAQSNAAKMREMHDKLVKEIAELNDRKEAVKAKIAVAKAQEKINKIGESMNGVGDNLSAFDRMESKAEKMLDQANAMAELNSNSEESSIDNLMDKYDSEPSAAVDDELAALKAKLGK